MTSMPASRSADAMTLAPRSWPSRPGLPTRMRARRMSELRRHVGAEHAPERGRDLADGRVGAHRLDDRRHEVGGPARLGLEPAEGAVGGGLVALGAHAAHARDLLALELERHAVDLHVRRLGLADEPVHARDHDRALLERALPLVGALADAPLHV